MQNVCNDVHARDTGSMSSYLICESKILIRTFNAFINGEVAAAEGSKSLPRNGDDMRCRRVCENLLVCQEHWHLSRRRTTSWSIAKLALLTPRSLHLKSIQNLPSLPFSVLVCHHLLQGEAHWNCRRGAGRDFGETRALPCLELEMELGGIPSIACSWVWRITWATILEWNSFMDIHTQAKELPWTSEMRYNAHYTLLKDLK